MADASPYLVPLKTGFTQKLISLKNWFHLKTWVHSKIGFAQNLVLENLARIGWPHSPAIPLLHADLNIRI
jgi:hypothetical protein